MIRRPFGGVHGSRRRDHKSRPTFPHCGSLEYMSKEFLRHTLATLAYRAGKTLRGVGDEFGSYKADPTSRSPDEILAHMGDLLDWAQSIASGTQEWHNSPPLPWAEGAARFHAALAAFDEYLASDAPMDAPAERIFQGAIADALTHTGQLAMLRRMSGQPMKGENYYRADIALGRVGKDQTPPKVEF